MIMIMPVWQRVYQDILEIYWGSVVMKSLKPSFVELSTQVHTRTFI